MASVVGRVPAQAGTAVEEVDARRGHDALVEVGAAAVVPDVVEAHVERGDPEDLGPGELGLGHPDAGLGGGHDQRPGVGEPQGRGQVDREPEVGRLDRRGLERQARGQRVGTHRPGSVAPRSRGRREFGNAGGKSLAIPLSPGRIVGSRGGEVNDEGG